MKDYTIEMGADSDDTLQEWVANTHPFWVNVRVKPIMSSIFSGEDEDMIKWCREQFGMEGTTVAWRKFGSLHLRVFRFKNSAHAVAFKVRWG